VKNGSMCLKAIQCELGNVTETIEFVLMCNITVTYLIWNLTFYLRRL
jgi:hypothetical protein